ncbi:MAG: hypothetical protein IH948_03015 [Bacteroidetes bacterium]|nr:hypothetical protein [Bacteroidota bacterium]
MIKSLTVTDPDITDKGPIIEVTIPKPEGYHRFHDGRSIPLSSITEEIKPIQVKALIDTGSANCWIADWIVDKFGLLNLGGKKARNTLGIEHISGTYQATIIFPTEPLELEIPGIAQNLPLIDSNFDCIIGRAILEHCTFTYNGKQNKFTMEFEVD